MEKESIYVVCIVGDTHPTYRKNDTVFSTASSTIYASEQKFLEETRHYDTLPDYVVVEFIRSS
jgi:hypothetical protein